MNGEQTRETPLAWSQAGDSFEVPDAGVVWRVRRLSGSAKGGAPELMYGTDGLPMMVDIAITPAEFADAVEGKVGKYRLDALDDQRRPLAGVPPAYFVVSAAAGARHERQDATSDVALKALADALKQQSDKLGDAFKQQSDQVNGLIAQVREFARCLVAERPIVQAVPPGPTALVAEQAPRNGAVLDGDDEDGDEDDDEASDDEDGEAATREPDWFDRAREFCATVPAENLRVIGELGPSMVADGVRKVLKEGITGFVSGDDKVGGGS